MRIPHQPSSSAKETSPLQIFNCKRLTNYTVGGLAGFRREFRGPSAGRESATRLLGKAAKPGSTEARCPCQKAGLRQDADHDLLTRCPLRNSVVNQCLLTSYLTCRTVVARSAPGVVVSSQRIGVGPWNHIRRSTHSAATPGEEKDLEIGWPVLAKVYRLSSRDHRCLAGIERNVLLCFVSTLSEISAGVGSTFHYVRQRARASETQHE
jgi:hypothetical protein